MAALLKCQQDALNEYIDYLKERESVSTSNNPRRKSKNNKIG